MKGYPQINVTFPKAIHGYWDGGAKQEGTFSAGYPFHRDGKEVIEYGSFGMNFYVVVRKFKDPFASARQAMKKLARICREEGAKWEITEWVEE